MLLFCVDLDAEERNIKDPPSPPFGLLVSLYTLKSIDIITGGSM